MKLSFCENWWFSLNDVDEAKELWFDHSCWEKVKLPHDFTVYFDFEKQAVTGPNGGFTKSGVGFYRKIFTVNKDDLKKRIFLEFDGIFMNGKIWINGIEVYQRPYGYISFGVDITKYLSEGENLIAVRADCEKQNQSRWFNGGGIYRNAWITVSEKIHVAHWGTFIKALDITHKSANMSYSIEIDNETSELKRVKLVSNIYYKDEKIKEVVLDNVDLQIGRTTIEKSILIENPKLWYPENPVLYKVETIICDENIEIDLYDTVFGIRKTEFIPNKGFFLNDKEYKFKGVCLHHDGGVVGAAVPDTIWRKRISLLKEMGCNAIRTAHNPFSPEFYDICDELGVFVMDEIFDGWEKAKATYDYGLYFNEWHERDCIDFIKRDRNHPSIVMWSIGNEVSNMNTEITKKLQDLFHSYDETRKVTCGVQGVGDVSEKNRALLDVAGYNDGGGACFLYERDHETRPDQLMVATEAPHTLQTRGHYRTQTWWRDKNQPRIEIENLTNEEIFTDGHILYASSYDNHGVRVCARDSYGFIEKLPYLCGEFRWIGIDYIGETDKWPMIKHTAGLIDTANFPKDHYYLYQSMWLNKNEKPMVHILPHWTHNDLEIGTVIPVWIYTNCDEVELFLNGVSLGKQTLADKKNLQFDVKYEVGEIKAIAYIDKKEICTAVQKTADTPSDISLTCDTKNVTFNGYDTIQIDCLVNDKNGIMAPKANNTIHFSVEGGARIVGTDNGDIVDHTKQTSPYRAAFNGLCALTIELSKVAEPIRITACGILGEKVFKDKTSITLVAKDKVVFGEMNDNNYKIYYSLNDYNEKIEYTNSFEINSTTRINIWIYNNSKLICETTELFLNGEKPKVIDLMHRNYSLDTKTPVGPFSKKLHDTWNDGQFEFIFKENGEFYRVLSGSDLQHMGYWWYDFPLDFFEAQEYAGTGEIWMNSGEKMEIKLKTQEAEVLNIDNSSGGIGHIWSFNKNLCFRKGKL